MPGGGRGSTQPGKTNYGLTSTNPQLRVSQYLQQTATPQTSATMGAAARERYRALSAPSTQPPPRPTYRPTGSSGGGGGGGVAAPKIDQSMLDWLAGMLGRGGPTAQTASNLDLPEFTGTFDPSGFNAQRTALNEAVGADTATAQQSTQRVMDFLGQNYQNAYTNPNNTYATAGQAPGMDQQAMSRLLAGQGVDPSVMAAEAAARAGADQAFGNMWRSSAANEDTAQRNRLNTATFSGQDALNRIRDMGLAGNAGLNIGQANAQSAFNQQAQERNWQTAQQEAMGNWTRANQVSDTNAQNQSAYRNQVLQALLGLFPDLAGAGLTLPGADVLGF